MNYVYGALAFAATVVAESEEATATASAAGAKASVTTEAWGKMTIVERITTYDWTKEALLAAFTVVYLFLHYYGASVNKKKVTKWIESQRAGLEAQFAQVGTHHPKGKDYVADSHEMYTTYASGRVNVSYMKAVMRMRPRQNLILYVMEFFMSIFMPTLVDAKEVIQVTIVPNGDTSKKIDPAIFAIVNKEGMQQSREESYYLSLTRTNESPKLPVELVFMTESGEISDHLYSSELEAAVKTPGATKVLQFLALTDQPVDRPLTPEEAVPKPQVALALNFPTNAEEEAATAAIINATVNLVDAVAKAGRWRPEVARKIKTTRDNEVKKIQKAIDEKKAEEAAQAKAEAKRAQQAKLSPAEQRKLEQKEREKDLRRQQKKGTRRVKG